MRLLLSFLILWISQPMFLKAQESVFRMQTKHEIYDSLNQYLSVLEDSSREMNLKIAQKQHFKPFENTKLHDNASAY